MPLQKLLVAPWSSALLLHPAASVKYIPSSLEQADQKPLQVSESNVAITQDSCMLRLYHHAQPQLQRKSHSAT